MSDEKAIVPETTSDIVKIELMFTHLHEHLEYMTKLLESVVEQFNLAARTKKDMANLADMNSEFMKSIFANKEFAGKDEFLAYIDKITRLGATK